MVWILVQLILMAEGFLHGDWGSDSISVDLWHGTMLDPDVRKYRKREFLGDRELRRKRGTDSLYLAPRKLWLSSKSSTSKTLFRDRGIDAELVFVCWV